MTSVLAKFNFRQGLHRESTQYEESGKWFDGNRVRFRAGKPENLRGYELKITDTFEGSGRDLLAYKSLNNKKRAVFGTPNKLYQHDGDRLVDITPITTTVTLANTFGTSSGSTRVCCSDAAHGRTVGDYVFFTSSAAFNNVSLQGNVYQIVSVESANVFAISVTDAANATGSDVGSATFNYLIPTGNSIAVAGTGYGAASYQATVCASDTRAWNQPASADATDIVFDITNWSLDNFETDVIANRNGSNIFFFESDASTTPIRATSVTNSPVSVNSIVVSNELHILALGTNMTSVSGPFNPMGIRFSDATNVSVWSPSAANEAGDITLVDGTKIVSGIRSRNAVNVWTDNSMWIVQYVGQPDIFRETQVGTNCGLIGQHGAVDYNGVSYWMGYDNFYKYDGSVQILDCTVRRFIFDRLNLKYKEKVFAGINSEFQEIIWLYTSNTSSATDCDSYVIFSPENNYWTYGDMFFTTFEDRTIFGNTITTGATVSGNNLYNNEPPGIFTGSNNEVLPSFIESGDFDIDDGNAIIFMDKLIPDFDINTGKIKLKFITKKYPESSDATAITKTFDITETTDKLNFRARGRQAKVRVSCSSQNTSWKWGAIRLGIQGDGQR